MTQTLQLDGRRAAFDESGPAAAPAILLIHGAGHDRGVWQAVAAGLAAAGRRVIVPDLPGHGDSEGEAPGAVDAMAAWVLAFADALGLERFELAGHSMGSLVALAAAAAAPGRIAACTCSAASRRCRSRPSCSMPRAATRRRPTR
jgi:pimeloyl-ACP methyl ester carboxylesterase